LEKGFLFRELLFSGGNLRLQEPDLTLFLIGFCPPESRQHRRQLMLESVFRRRVAAMKILI
jgi:hypothetical protein